MGFNRDDWDDKSIKIGSLEGDVKRFFALIGEMTGHGGDIKQALTQGANNFTEMIQDSIKSQASYDEDLWQQAAMNCVVGAGCTSAFIGHVREFRKTLDELQEEWDSFPPPPSEIKTETGSDGAVRNTGDLSPNLLDYYDRRQEKLRDLERRAEKALDVLEDRTAEINGDIESGAKDIVVKKLVEDGMIGWSAYNILGTGQPVPIAFDGSLGKKDGKKAAEAIQNGDEVPEEIIAGLTYLNTVGVEHRANGGNLREEELEYLKSFYSELDSHLEDGLLGITEDIVSSGEFTNEEVNKMLSTIGGGLLTLSHEELGGGLDYLPESVVNVVDGPKSKEYNHLGWERDLFKLNSLIHGTDEQIEGGREFSAGLTTAIALELKDGHLLSTLDESMVLRYDTSAPKSLAPGLLQEILGVTTRNDDANYSILTGEYGHPNYDGKTPSDVLEGLFDTNWADDGRAAAKLINWIPDAATSDDVELQKMAGKATLGLVEATTDDDAFSKFTNGEKGEKSIGRVNPEISLAMGDVVQVHMYDFGRPGGEYAFLEGVEGINDDTLSMPLKDRIKFLQLVASSDEAAADMYASINANETLALDSYLSGNARPEAVAVNTGRFRGMFDTALFHDGLDRYNMESEAAKRAKDMNEGGANKLYDMTVGQVVDQYASKLPLVGGEISDKGNKFIKGLWNGDPSQPIFNEEVQSYEDYSVKSRESVRLNIQLQTMDHLGIRFPGPDGGPASSAKDFPAAIRDDMVGKANGNLEDSGHGELADDYFQEYDDAYKEIEMERARTADEYKEQYSS
ncbi:TPR repeat region-containing protein [Nocardiopsis halophila]|uniref:TPR repeat region-containing protein n=1 Tax=Nocardiopsis halophila TaxID=141692 RepID=UPI00034DDE13|nr:hypothetical protein [Nocardiopsis halophila]